jgi:diguanylate cyclase (GGDEF)-like protein
LKPAPTPADEKERLGELRGLGLLDTEAEERFDRYTRIARQVFDVPIALVSLVDGDRQWFKSKSGLDVCETPRDVSFCGHAIVERGLLVVEDTQSDERFADNPLVTGEPKIRFYAGAPVPIRSGKSALGTFCIIDTKPRTLTPGERTLLRDLADSVGEAILAVDMASLDDLTRISNRRGLLALGRRSFETARQRGKKLSTVFIDLDRFKEVNDLHGHAAGDGVLREVAGAMREAFRESDVLGRMGGDEFCAVLPTASQDQTERAVERLRGLLENVEVKPGLRGVDFSYGVVELDPDRHQSFEDILAEADERMYSNKRASE